MENERYEMSFPAMTTPLISVIMPAYNSSMFIRAAIDSVLNQTEQRFELVIVNDGSTDDTEALVQSYDSAKIRYYANPKNLGIAKTYNRALGVAHGEFIAIAEHDDISHPQRLAIQANYLQRHPKVGVVGSAYKDFSGKSPTFRSIRSKKVKAVCSPEKVRASHIFSIVVVPNAVAMIRREVLTKHRITFDASFRIGADSDLYQRLVQVTDLVNLNCVLLFYRRHLDNASGDPAKVRHEIVKLREHFYRNTFGIDIGGVMDSSSRVKNANAFAKLESAIEKLVDTKIHDPRYDATVLRNRKNRFLFRALCADSDEASEPRTMNYAEIYATYKNSNLPQQLDITRKLRIHTRYLFFRIAALKRTASRNKT